MHMKSWIVSLLALLWVVSVDAQQYFGEKIDDKGITPMEEVISSLEVGKKVHAKVKGQVTGVCKMKGCWMTIQDEKGNEFFVRFKDYGFFVPMDIEGKTAVIEGEAFIHITPVEELRHYAEDEGKSKEEIEKITEPKREYRFTASGVIIYD